MQKSRFLLVFPCLLACLGAWLFFTAGARADLPVSETGLNPSGWAFEINPDDQGLLWISDSTAGQIWGLYPDDEFFEIYPVTGFPSDARHEGNNLWWADGKSNILGWASTLDGAYITWQVPGVTGFSGTALDSAGRLWVTSANSASLYRLDTTKAELCTMTLPSGGKSTYIVRDAGYLWMGDEVNARLLRLTVGDYSLSLTAWSLPTDSTPVGMAVDGQGNLWYADSNLKVLGRLNPDPETPSLTSYSVPLPSLPTMVALQEDRVWYSSIESLTNPGSIGTLDPLTASSANFTPAVETTMITPDCSPISPSSTGFLAITTEDTAWNTLNYPTLVDENGWQIYQLPEDSSPWGIANAEGVWFADQGRQVLAKLPKETETKIYLPLLVRR